MPCPIARRLELAATSTTHAQLYYAVPEVPEERWKIQPDTKETGTPVSAAASGWLNWPEASLLVALTNPGGNPSLLPLLCRSLLIFLAGYAHSLAFRTREKHEPLPIRTSQYVLIHLFIASGPRRNAIPRDMLSPLCLGWLYLRETSHHGQPAPRPTPDPLPQLKKGALPWVLPTKSQASSQSVGAAGMGHHRTQPSSPSTSHLTEGMEDHPPSFFCDYLQHLCFCQCQTRRSRDPPAGNAREIDGRWNIGKLQLEHNLLPSGLPLRFLKHLHPRPPCCCS
ncbi:hypothetical protein K456DRAFT_29168 [Colletotrichum gloeosporioides 23]|nr:hypothetical protein K456DRAFT_29168 [Colletotrichum gloeosporioides 23]